MATGRRLAFLIGNQSFAPSSGLHDLQGPGNDVAALSAVLSDAEKGGYEVTVFHDRERGEILPVLEAALSGATGDDAILLFYAGHGKTDRAGRLCLATHDSREDAIYSTSIRASDLYDMIDNSDCNQVVLLLDCCFSGAAGRDFTRGSVQDQIQMMQDAKGLHVLTATTGHQTAREEEAQVGSPVMGKFTRAIVDGITTGSADRNRDGVVSINDLRTYLPDALKGQKPQYFARNATDGDPTIARIGPLETPLQRRLRQLGAWHAAGDLSEADYLAISDALSRGTDAALRRRMESLLDNPRASPAAVSALWAGATRPPPRPAAPPEVRHWAPPPEPAPPPPVIPAAAPIASMEAGPLAALKPRLGRKGKRVMIGGALVWVVLVGWASEAAPDEAVVMGLLFTFLLACLYALLLSADFLRRLADRFLPK